MSFFLTPDVFRFLRESEGFSDANVAMYPVPMGPALRSAYAPSPTPNLGPMGAIPVPATPQYELLTDYLKRRNR